ncbi:MAG: type IV pilus modification PilV family protein [Patescibacteria group bacterium]
MIKLFKNENGIGLIETLVALGISLIVITSLVSLSVFTLRTSTQSKLLLQSSKLVNEEIELARAFRDSTDWATFTATMGNCDSSNCYITTSSGIGVSSGTETIGSGADQITRFFTTSDPINGDGVDASDNLVRIAVTVSWRVGTDVKYAHSYTELSNWRPE